MRTRSVEQILKTILTATGLRLYQKPVKRSKITYQELAGLVERLVLEGKKPEPAPRLEKPRWLDGVPKNRKLPLELFIKNFWSRVVVDDGGCWNWSGPFVSRVESRKYGSVYWSGTKLKTHKLSYVFEHGQIKPGMFICHKCDNPKCVNPGHLFQGTPMENAQDCILKNRAVRERGEKRYCAKLSEEKVRQIRGEYKKEYGSITRLARKHGVSPTAIYNAVHSVRWKHVEHRS